MKSLIVPGKLDSLSSVAQYVLEAAAAAGLDKKATYRLRLAVDEITTNIITYGYEESGIAGDITARADIDDHTLTITLEDTSQPFDPLKRMEPEDLDLPLEQRNIGGLGIYLAINGVDKFTYERVDGRNRNTFVVYREPRTKNQEPKTGVSDA
jgi:anti-sigma regulatory factor (Ser/Thr protein kinase)